MITEILIPQGGLTFTDILIIGVGILLTIIGWFLKGFSHSVKELKTTVENIMTTVAVEQEKIKNVKDSISEFTTQLSNKVNNIGTMVDRHEKDIAILQILENEHHNISL